MRDKHASDWLFDAYFLVSLAVFWRDQGGKLKARSGRDQQSNPLIYLLRLLCRLCMPRKFISCLRGIYAWMTHQSTPYLPFRHHLETIHQIWAVQSRVHIYPERQRKGKGKKKTTHIPHHRSPCTMCCFVQTYGGFLRACHMINFWQEPLGVCLIHNYHQPLSRFRMFCDVKQASAEFVPNPQPLLNTFTVCLRLIFETS